MSRKEKLKVYHGIPKSVTDINTLFYTNFNDGVVSCTSNKYKQMPCGTGVSMSKITTQTLSNVSTEVTLDFWINAEKTLTSSGSWFAILEGYDSTSQKVFGVVHDQYSLFITFPGFIWDNSFKLTLNENTHFRVVFAKNRVSIYVNGKLQWERTSATFNVEKAITWKLFNGEHPETSLVYISDVHFSNVDRGSYFPILPQDFIDGKAIIRPRFGQQQIKGDPFYSQTTKLRVPHNKDNVGNYSNIANTDGRFTHNQYPELSCLGASTWASGTSLKITGLNGEIIGGVIDSDTSICRVLRVIDATHLEVDSTTKLSIGDTFLYGDSRKSRIDSGANKVITEIQGNVITYTGDSLTSSAFQDGWDLLYETTTTSSSPIVKTINNNTVDGTWTGLGTNEAIFTVGTNTSALVEGKDLVVTYSLNIKMGNSDFTELPYAINKVYDEVGNQLVEVSEFNIEDDFKSKVVGDIKICPHISGYSQGKVIPAPTDFTEISQDKYTALETANDVFSWITSSGGSTDITFQLFSFNVAEMIYRKVGFKYLYLGSEVRDLIESIKIYWKGASSSTTKPTCTLYNYSSSLRGWQSIGSHSSTSNTAIESTVDVNNIDIKGFLHFCASQSDTSGSLKTDYVKITVKLKKEANYSCFYVDNIRAREFPCNPVLIQKETKTVKRLIPTDKCFSTEYLSYGVNPKITTDISTKTHVADSEIMFVTTEGTGMYDNNLIRSSSKNVIARLGVPIISPHLYIPLPLVSKQPWNGSTSAILPYKYIRATNSILAPFNLYNMPQDDLPTCKLVALTKYLDKVNGELFLKVLVQEHSNGVYQAYRIASYKLPNRPLIK